MLTAFVVMGGPFIADIGSGPQPLANLSGLVLNPDGTVYGGVSGVAVITPTSTLASLRAAAENEMVTREGQLPSLADVRFVYLDDKGLL